MSSGASTVKKYEPGLNEYLDAILDGETVFRIQGDRGLRPIIADTEDEAVAKYLAIPKPNYGTMEGL